VSIRTIIGPVNGVEYTAHIATIKNTRLGYQDHGIMTAELDLRWTGAGVWAPGYCLDQPDRAEDAEPGTREGTAYGLDHVIRILEAVGVSKWEDLTGRKVFVLFPEGGGWGSSAAGLANIDTGKAFIFKEHAEAWKVREP
jgi:hypothetical protein